MWLEYPTKHHPGHQDIRHKSPKEKAMESTLKMIAIQRLTERDGTNVQEKAAMALMAHNDLLVRNHCFFKFHVARAICKTNCVSV